MFWNRSKQRQPVNPYATPAAQPAPAAPPPGHMHKQPPPRQAAPPRQATAPPPQARAPPPPAAGGYHAGGGGNQQQWAPPAQAQPEPTEEPPSRYLCPITMALMQDPVMSRSGINYERVSIEHWLRSNNTCPSTREPMSKNDLFPNRALKEEIEEWRNRHAGGRPQTPPHRPATPPVQPHHQPPQAYARVPPVAGRPPQREPEKPWVKYGIPQDDYDFICALFVSFDDDDGGTLDRQELTRLATWLNYPHSEHDIDLMFRTMDRDGDGALSMEEFLSYYIDKKPNPQFLYGMQQREYNEMLMQFHSCDGDANGELDRDEFYQLCKRAGYASTKRESDNIFDQVDADKGGTVDLHEFLTYMRPFRTK